MLRRAVTIFEALLAVDPENIAHQRDLAACHAALGEAPLQWGDRVSNIRKAIALREEIVKHFPAVLLYRRELATSYRSLGNHHVFSKRPGGTEHLDRAREIGERLCAEDPADPGLLNDLGTTLRDLGTEPFWAGRCAEAEPFIRRATAIHDELVTRLPTRPQFRAQLGWDTQALSYLLIATRRPDEARRISGRAVAMYEGLSSEFPDVLAYRDSLATALAGQAMTLILTGHRSEAEKFVARMESMKGVTDVDEKLCQIAGELVQSDARGPVEPAYAVEFAARLVARRPRSNYAWHVMGMARYRAGQWDEAITALARANELEHDSGLAFNGFFLAMAYQRKGNGEMARTWYDRSVAWMAEHKPNNVYAARYCAEAAALLELEPPRTASKRELVPDATTPPK